MRFSGHQTQSSTSPQVDVVVKAGQGRSSQDVGQQRDVGAQNDDQRSGSKDASNFLGQIKKMAERLVLQDYDAAD